METVREYLLGVICAAVCCSMALALLGSKNTVGSGVKWLAGIFMTLTVLAPISHLKVDSVLRSWNPEHTDADSMVAAGESYARENLEKIIKSRTEAYIEKKAGDLGAAVQAEVTLDSQLYPVPVSVTLIGSLSPYARRQMQKILERELAIPSEAQKWILKP